MKHVLFFMLLCFSTKCAMCQDDDVKRIKELNAKLLGTYSTRDTATLAKLLADDFVIITVHGAQLPKSQFLEGVAQTGTDISFKVESQEVKLFGNAAILTVFGSSTVTDSESTSTKANCYTDVLIKKDGIWKIVNAHISLLNQ